MTASTDEAPAETSGKRRRQLVAIGKLLLMIAPLVWIFPRIDLASIAARVARFGVPSFLLAAVILSLTVVVSGLRWRELLRAHGASPLPTRRRLIEQTFISLYMNQLPGGVAGDVLRAHAVRECVHGTPTSLAVLLFERVCGLLALGGMVAIGTLNLPVGDGARLGGRIGNIALVGAGLMVLGIGVPLLASRSKPIVELLLRLPVVGSVLGRLRRPTRIGPMISAVMLSFVIHAISVVVITAFFRALAPDASMRTVVAVTPIAMLVTFIPLTPAGFGQRETAFVELYKLAGVSANDAVAASLLWFGASTFSIALGLVLATAERIRAARGPSR